MTTSRLNGLNSGIYTSCVPFTTATSSAMSSISTSVFCCPSNYAYTQSGTDQRCISTLKSGSIPRSILAPSAISSSWIDVTITTIPTIVRSAVVNGYIFADSTSSSKSRSPTSSTKSRSSISSSKSRAPTSSTKSRSSTSKLKTSTKATKKSSPTSASSSTSSRKKRKKKTSLDTGALVGIVIGAVLVAALVILFVVLRNRKKRKGAQEEPEVAEDKGAGGARDSKEVSSGGKEPAVDHSPFVVGGNA
ncbi:hypothetical protein DL98DRAFT_577575 [Cadophora sp. DSE1049]|nr:hypothetical protein DL98DRAFT_577575 [Cadophora sp. DSE1049]